jgi:hypothetical protein
VPITARAAAGLTSRSNEQAQHSNDAVGQLVWVLRRDEGEIRAVVANPIATPPHRARLTHERAAPDLLAPRDPPRGIEGGGASRAGPIGEAGVQGRLGLDSESPGRPDLRGTGSRRGRVVRIAPIRARFIWQGTPPAALALALAWLPETRDGPGWCHPRIEPLRMPYLMNFRFRSYVLKS